ncbi:hypothetical protein [Mycobacterium sp. NAZ190054]|uniref:hypothetical protein n=1 Tax=Mycobacterium sp. NAZ190054 TaxID=1747766 RepID=UPI000791603F|nr:hypothetical protein [Mycobacterium sp. NAZ190054]KWX69211.1 hypothetical protein ASJ79_02405 [Mycobacterium sp. NAZ190054]
MYVLSVVLVVLVLGGTSWLLALSMLKLLDVAQPARLGAGPRAIAHVRRDAWVRSWDEHLGQHGTRQTGQDLAFERDIEAFVEGCGTSLPSVPTERIQPPSRAT